MLNRESRILSTQQPTKIPHLAWYRIVASLLYQTEPIFITPLNFLLPISMCTSMCCKTQYDDIEIVDECTHRREELRFKRGKVTAQQRVFWCPDAGINTSFHIYALAWEVLG